MQKLLLHFYCSRIDGKTIRQLSNVNITIQKGLAAASEIFEQLDHDNENDEGSQTSTISGNIEFKNVSFAMIIHKMFLIISIFQSKRMKQLQLLVNLVLVKHLLQILYLDFMTILVEKS